LTAEALAAIEQETSAAQIERVANARERFRAARHAIANGELDRIADLGAALARNR